MTTNDVVPALQREDRQALPDRSQPPALPRVDARPDPDQPDHAEPLVADQEATARCPFCGAVYGLGETVGEELLSYPDGERRYWAHCLTERHQAVMRARHRSITEMLEGLPSSLSSARLHQREMANPVRQALKEILR